MSYITEAIEFIKMAHEDIQKATKHADWRAIANRSNLSYDHGATRAVIIGRTFVVKFDFGEQYNIDRFGGCRSEWLVWQTHKNDKFANILAPCTLFAYGGKKFYIMPFVNGVGSSEKELYDLIDDEEEEWLEDIGLFDLHTYNFGFRNGKPVVIDYAAVDDD